MHDSFFHSIKHAIKKNATKDNFLILVVICFVIIIMMVSKIGCPIKYFTGINCPGCGMTRALFSAIHLNFHRAFHFHPLWWSIPVIIIVWLLKEAGIIPAKHFKIILASTLILFVAVYMFRMFDSSDVIVTAHPAEGYLIKKILYFYSLVR